MKTLLTSAFLIGILTQCYYDHEGILYPGSENCTPSATPSFSVDVLPVLEARCNSCHSGSFPSAGIRLDAYVPVQAYVSDGSLIGSIRHSSGFSPMPKSASKMSSCEIEKIQNWINDGAPDN